MLPFVTGTELGPGGELGVAVEIRDHFKQDYDQYSFFSSFLFLQLLRLFQRVCDCHRDTQAAAGGRGGATY